MLIIYQIKKVFFYSRINGDPTDPNSSDCDYKVIKVFACTHLKFSHTPGNGKQSKVLYFICLVLELRTSCVADGFKKKLFFSQWIQWVSGKAYLFAIDILFLLGMNCERTIHAFANRRTKQCTVDSFGSPMNTPRSWQQWPEARKRTFIS